MNEQYIQKLIEGEVETTVYLRNGVKLVCKIIAQDKDTVLTTGKGNKQNENLVWKDSIASIVRAAMTPDERQSFLQSIKS